MAVLLVPIALIVLLFRFIGGDREVTVVDPGPPIAEAQRAGLAVLKPRGLSDEWKPTSAITHTEDGSVTLRIGYVTPSGGFAQLVETNADAEAVMRKELGGGPRPDGTVRIGDARWQTYPARGNERALVLLEPERTILVVGKAPDRELRDLANSLY